MARPRTLLPIGDIPLVGGALCLDFVNTTGARASGSPRERLTQYRDLVTWSARAGILDARAAAKLTRAARSRPEEARRVLARAHAIRETLYALLFARSAGRQPDEHLVGEFVRHWRNAQGHQHLAATGKGFEIRFRDNQELDWIVAPVVMSAVDVLTSDRLALVRRCAECDWLFLDESKNGTRRWCKAMCGNRARSRDRYDRRRRGTEPR